MKVRTLIALMVLSIPMVAGAEEAATKSDVAELKQEVQALRALLERFLEVEEQRSRGLAEVLAEAKSGKVRTEPVSRTNTIPPTNAERRAPEVKGEGSLSGRLKITGTSAKVPAYVFVEDVPGRLAKGKTVTIRQVEKKFVPSVAVVQRGTKVIFPNDDKIFHNVFSLTPGSSFDLGTYRSGDKPGEYVFTQTGVVDVFCNLHSNMNASVLVVPNALFTKVGADGKFTISGIPAGKRRIIAWTPNVPPVSRTVEISPNGTAQLEVELEGRDGVPVHTDKNGMPYGSYK